MVTDAKQAVDPIGEEFLNILLDSAKPAHKLRSVESPIFWDCLVERDEFELPGDLISGQ